MKMIYIDIDNTICETQDLDYTKSTPIYRNINLANKLYEEGNQIVYWTARGTKSGIDWYDLTKSQLDNWGVMYHEIKMGKPAYDIFIDDKNINTSEWVRNSENIIHNKKLR